MQTSVEQLGERALSAILSHTLTCDRRAPSCSACPQDHLAFLNPSFDSREYAQKLLNGGHSAANDAANAFHVERRSLEAVQQLGLASSGAVAVALNGASSASGKDTVLYTPKHATAATTASSGSGDVSVALSKLSYAVDDLNRQLRSEINTHHAALLVQAGSVSSLEDNLRQIRGGLDEVESSVDRLRRKISVPYTDLSTSLTRLAKLQRASDLARRAGRFVTLARRLDVQMAELNAANSTARNGLPGSTETAQSSGTAIESTDRPSASDSGERALSEAALTLAELDVLLDEGSASEGAAAKPVSVRAITAVSSHIPAVEANRERVIDEMEIMIRRGLQSLNQSLLASSLQTAYNLSVLPSLVSSLVQDLIEAIESRIKGAFDVAALSRDAAARAGEPVPSNNVASSVFYKSRARTEPTNSNLPHFQAALWSRLEGLIEDMAGCCIKVYVLERVLKLKRDPLGQGSFLEDALTTLEHKPTFTFWTTLSQSFEMYAKEAGRQSSFVQQTLSTNYPRLLRLFHEFFSKIALQSDTVYSQNQQSPETVLILRSISTFENMYLSRCANRLNEAIGTAFSGGPRAPPTHQEGLTCARVIGNELDAARFDPLLMKNVAKSVVKAVDSFTDRTEGMIATDYTATSMVGPLATPSQQLNAELASTLYHFWTPLTRIQATYPANIQEQLKTAIQGVRQCLASMTTPLLNAVRREFAAIVGRIHKTGFNKPLDPTSTSVYMQDLSDRFNFVRRQILAPLRVGELMKEWVSDLCRYTLHRFVLHASIVHPLGEGGKLKLTTDLTTMEFAISQLLSDYKLNLAALDGDYRALRALRPMLFTETASLADPVQTKDVPPLVLYHHLIVRSNAIQLPHQMHSWQEAEYVKFVSEHSDLENRRLIEAALKSWEEGDQMDASPEAKECASILRTVLQRDKQQ